jgi:hypothetical protein
MIGHCYLQSRQERPQMFSNTWFVVFLVAMASSHAHAEKAKDKPQPTIHGKAESANMTNAQAWTMYAKYVEGWNDITDEQRAKIAAEILAENVQYMTPRHDWTGRATIIEDMASFQKKFPKGHFEIGDVSANHDVALLTWVLVQADGKVLARGHDQMRVSPDGKIVNLITFAPSQEKP